MEEKFVTKMIFLYAQKMMQCRLTEFEVLLYESLCNMTAQKAKLLKLACRLQYQKLEKGETDGNAC